MGLGCECASPQKAELWELSVVFNSLPPRPRRSHRNLRKGPSGLADEISFEDFLTIMAYFQPIDTAMDEEQVHLCRREKLRCAHPSPFCSGRGRGGGGPNDPTCKGRQVSLLGNCPMAAAS